MLLGSISSSYKNPDSGQNTPIITSITLSNRIWYYFLLHVFLLIHICLLAVVIFISTGLRWYFGKIAGLYMYISPTYVCWIWNYRNIISCFRSFENKYLVLSVWNWITFLLEVFSSQRPHTIQEFLMLRPEGKLENLLFNDIAGTLFLNYFKRSIISYYH